MRIYAKCFIKLIEKLYVIIYIISEEKCVYTQKYSVGDNYDSKK